MPRRDQATLARADDLARMEREACGVTVRPPDALPPLTVVDHAPERARGVFDHGNTPLPSDRNDPLQITRHAHLMDAEYGARPIRDRLLDLQGIDIESSGVDVDEHRSGATIGDAIDGRDK